MCIATGRPIARLMMIALRLIEGNRTCKGVSFPEVGNDAGRAMAASRRGFAPGVLGFEVSR